MKRNEYKKIKKNAHSKYIKYIKNKEDHLWVGYSGRLHRGFNAVVDYRWFNFKRFELGDVKIGSDSFIIGD